ncbi:hypothetical protein [Sphingomonas sp. OTU376]|uniref:hypothetical protein n=1 Tax=Sphingomonas sp. OTU376 TaxID=3043863 RepID=UPI00313E1050
MRAIIAVSLISCALPIAAAAQQNGNTEAIQKVVEGHPTFARYVNPLCNKRAKPVLTTAAEQSFARLGELNSASTSFIAEIRQCLKKAPIQLQAAGIFDRVDVEGTITTAGRIGGGIFYYAKAPDEDATSRVSTFGIRLSGYAGWEDFDIPSVTSGGPVQHRRGKRAAKIAETSLIYTIQDLTGDSKFPLFPLGAATIHVTGSYIDKRTPMANVPAYLNEGFFDLNAGVSLDQFLDHDPFGSKLNYFVGYEHIFNRNYAVRDIGAVRVQWRPQKNPAFDNPDVLAVHVQYRFGKDYRGISAGLSKSF